ncbi:unnamed protein product [Closterium sp. NIES-53]
MASRALVSGLPRSLPPLPPGPAPTCVPCVEGRQPTAAHSSSFPRTEAPLQTLHMDVWGPARVRGQGHEHYFLLVVDDYSRYTTVFPLRSKDRGGEFSFDLLRAFYRLEGIRQTFTLPASPQQNGIAERRTGMVMDVAHTSMIYAAAPHFLWPFAVQYAAHQINLQPRVSLPETTPTLRWTGKVGGTPLVDPLPPQGPAPSGVSQVDPAEPVEVAVDSGAKSGGAEPAGAGTGGPETGGAESGGAEPARAASRGALGVPPRREPLSPQQLREWYSRLCQGTSGASGGAAGAGATGGAAGARGAAGTSGGAAGAGAAGVATGTGGRAFGRQCRDFFRAFVELLQVLESYSLRAASPTVTRFWATAVTDPLFESSVASALVTELVDFAAACRLDYAACLVAASVSVCPPSVGGECAPCTDVLEDRREEFECFAASVPHLVSMLLAPEGDPDALDIPTPRSYTEAIEGPYSSQWHAAMDAEMASWKSTGTYVDEVPPPGANIVSGMWIFRVQRPPGSPPAFKARYVARGFSQRQGVDFFQTFSPTPNMTTLWVLLHVAAQRDYKLHSLDFSTAFLQSSLHEDIWLRRPPGFTGSFPAGTQWSLRRPVYGLRQAPREWYDTLRTTLASLGFSPSTADPSLFLCTDATLPSFYVLVYVDDLVFATADTEALTHVKSELQKRHTCTDLGELTSYLGLRITRDRAQHTITLTQSHMVQQVLQRFGFTYSSPQSTPLPTGHSLSAPPSDESVEPSGPYPELVGCLMYLMTCTRPDLAYPLSLLARYVAPGRHRKLHWDAAKRVLRYLCSTLGMGLMLGGRAQVVLTGHADASWVDDLAAQRSSQGYTFSLGSGSVSWRSTRSSFVLSSSCEVEIYAGAMAAQELRWLTYLLTDLGEAPRSPPVLYVDNKAMLALYQEHRLEHRTKHIALRYFLARELQQRGQLRLAFVASQANTADVFTKALQPCDHQRFCTVLGLLALLFLTGLVTPCSPPLCLWGVDYFQTFSPTPKMTTLWVLLHVAAQRDYELHSLDFSTAFLQGSLHEEIWLRRPPGFTGTFPAGTQWSLRQPFYGLRQAPREWHDTLRTTLAALGFAPSTADPSLFLRTDMSLPPFYVLVYVDDLVFATADTEALTLVKSELQKRHTCTDLGELLSYLGLQITRDRARRTITLTQSHMVHQVLQRFGFQFSSPQPTPLSTSHLLSSPPSDESVEPSGLYPGLVGCLMYLMTCTRPDLAYPLSLLASYGAPVRRAWGSCLEDGVHFSNCEAEIYAGAMAAQELRWLTYLLTDLGEQPRSPPVLYVDNKAMIALCQEHRLEHKTKHIAMRYFLARELQQRGQLRLAYVATRANTADVFTKALPPGDHQRFTTVLGLAPTLPHVLTT